MSVKLYFFSNVTLGYGSPKYINFIKTCAESNYIKEISTIEPMESVREKYQLPNVDCKRRTLGSKLWTLPLLKIFTKSHRLNKYIVNPVNALLLNFSILYLSLKSLFKPIAIVTTYEHALFGCFSKKAIICQNYSEIWQENDEEGSVGFIARCKKGLVDRYRANVKFLIAPQEDRLVLAKEYYPNASTFLVHNAPALSNEFCIPERKEKKVILYQGRISKLSLGDKLMAFAEALPPSIELHIAGIVNKEYQDKVKALNERNNITYHGYLKWDELTTLRSKCNIGILAWSNDSLNTKYCAPNKLYEYIASGMYVACFDNFSLAKLQREFNFGHLETGTAIDLAKHFEELTMDTIQNVGLQNFQLYNSRLNFELQHDDFFTSFSKLVNE